jgi:hypothetical protein
LPKQKRRWGNLDQRNDPGRFSHKIPLKFKRAKMATQQEIVSRKFSNFREAVLFFSRFQQIEMFGQTTVATQQTNRSRNF